jgi:hypothetical protein
MPRDTHSSTIIAPGEGVQQARVERALDDCPQHNQRDASGGAADNRAGVVEQAGVAWDLVESFHGEQRQKQARQQQRIWHEVGERHVVDCEHLLDDPVNRRGPADVVAHPVRSRKTRQDQQRIGDRQQQRRAPATSAAGWGGHARRR